MLHRQRSADDGLTAYLPRSPSPDPPPHHRVQRQKDLLHVLVDPPAKSPGLSQSQAQDFGASVSKISMISLHFMLYLLIFPQLYFQLGRRSAARSNPRLCGKIHDTNRRSFSSSSFRYVRRTGFFVRIR